MLAVVKFVEWCQRGTDLRPCTGVRASRGILGFDGVGGGAEVEATMKRVAVDHSGRVFTIVRVGVSCHGSDFSLEKNFRWRRADLQFRVVRLRISHSLLRRWLQLWV